MERGEWLWKNCRCPVTFLQMWSLHSRPLATRLAVVVVGYLGASRTKTRVLHWTLPAAVFDIPADLPFEMWQFWMTAVPHVTTFIRVQACLTLSAFGTFVCGTLGYFQQRTLETALVTTTLGVRLLYAFIDSKRPVPDMQYIHTVPADRCVGIP
jgi:hypothetical protein